MIRSRGTRGTIAAVAVASLVLSGCSSSEGSPPPAAATTNAAPTSPEAAPRPSATPTEDDTGADEAPAPATTGAPAGCRTVDGTPLRAEDTVTLEQIDEQDGMVVYAAEYPLPGDTDGLWSQWGQGVAVPATGEHWSAVGDHLGEDGNSHLFRYDPATRELTRAMDMLSFVDHQSGAWGYGKVHAPLVVGACGTVLGFTYWGTKTDLEYGDGYEGDVLFEVDPAAGTVRSHGPVAGQRGVPSATVTADGGHVVGEAAVPEGDDDLLVVVHGGSGEVAHRIEAPGHDGFRALVTTADGRVWYSRDDQRLVPVDPATGEVQGDDAVALPTDDDEDFLRAATAPGPDGRTFAVTQESEVVFSLDTDGEVEEVASAGGYTTSLAMVADGSRVFWLPGAHGDAWEEGAVVRQLDVATGEVDDLVALAEPFEDALGLRPGGTYSITHHDGRLLLGVNASDLDDDSGFGTVVLVVVEGIDG